MKSSYDNGRPIYISFTNVVAGHEITHHCALTQEEADILDRLREEHPEMVKSQMGKLVNMAKEEASKTNG